MLTIAEVLKLTHAKREMFGIFFATFLDYFYRAGLKQRFLMVKEEPVKYENISIGKYAYIAGSVENLCRKYEVEFPKWVYKDKYFLKEPYFSLNAKGMLRVVLVIESPIEYRMRNVFVNDNTLTRV